MAAEYSANASQTVQPGGSLIFTETPVPCNRGLIYHRDESGLFRLASPSAINGGCVVRSCCCDSMPRARYWVAFKTNAQIPEGGTAAPISLAIAIDGEVDPSSIATFTPAAAAELGNVSARIIVEVPWICRCASVSVRNVSAQAVEIQNANIIFAYLGISR